MDDALDIAQTYTEEWYPENMSWPELTQHPNFPLYIFLLGLSCIALAAFLIWRKVRFFRNCNVTPARVTSFDKRSALEGNLWQVIVEFTDDQGIKRQLEYIGSTPYPPFARAKNLKVYYDPKNPEKAFAYEFWKVWGAELATSSVALFISLLGAAQLYI